MRNVIVRVVPECRHPLRLQSTLMRKFAQVSNHRLLTRTLQRRRDAVLGVDHARRSPPTQPHAHGAGKPRFRRSRIREMKAVGTAWQHAMPPAPLLSTCIRRLLG